MKKTYRISPLKELWLLLKESLFILFAQKRNLIISLLFPIGASAITIWIAGKDMLINMESTKSASFILVCAAIWGGLFNSIQVIVKERKNIRRDHISGALRISCYTLSRALVQILLCAIQSIMLCLSYLGVELFYGNNLPGNGIIFDNVIMEYYITIFLVMCSADTLGLMISSLVKSEQLASQLSPYVLIVQLLFSGVLFTLKEPASSISAFMISRWGMEALGSISNLNALPLRLHEEFPMIPHEADQAFLYTGDHLQKVWLVLVAFIVIQLFISNSLLHRVSKDKRG